jgi:CRP/FNR family transcriptional regulator, cyclic AMP receptor protein
METPPGFTRGRVWESLSYDQSSDEVLIAAQTDSVAAALHQTAIFGELDDSAIRELAQVCLERTYRRNQYLWYQGDPGDYLVVIVSGLVKVTVSSPHGDEMLLVTLGPSEVVGELSVIDGGRRSGSVVALRPTKGIVIGRAPLIALMQRSPICFDVLLRSLGALVRRLTEQATDLVFLDLAARVAKLLLREAERQSGVQGQGAFLDLGLTQTELAQMVGASRPAVNRVLQSLVARGLIGMDGRMIKIYDPKALGRRAGL